MRTRKLNKEQFKNKQMGQIVAEDYRTSEIFLTYGLDYCCQGDKTVDEACNNRGIDTEAVLNALSKVYRLPIARQEINMEPDPVFLMTYIINQRHKLLISRIRRVGELVKNKLSVISDVNPVFYKICMQFIDLCGEMDSHIREEEQDVFPLFANRVDGTIKMNILDEKVIKTFADNARKDHEHIGRLLAHIRDLENSLIPPEISGTLTACEVIAGSEDKGNSNEICSLYRVLRVNISELDSAIRDCVHLENNRFIPSLTRYLQMN